MRRTIGCALLACALVLSLSGGGMAAGKEVVAPSGLLVRADGSMLIADVFHRALWQQNSDGALTRLAGREGVRDVDGQPLGGYNDGPAAQAAFQSPWAIAPYLDGYAVTDMENNVVRYFAGGNVTTLAGSGKSGLVNGAGTKSAFDGPTGLTAGPDGCLYVADTGNHVIRKVDAKGTVTTFAGGGAGKTEGTLSEARFLEPTGLYYSGGILYVADSGNNRICKIENGAVMVVAGGGQEDSAGFRDGPAKTALFSHPQGLAASGGAVYVADTGNGAVRMVRGGTVSTLLRTGEGAGGLAPVSPRGMAISNGQLYVGDVFARTSLTLRTDSAFTDVPANVWYADAVAEVSGLGLLRGVSQDRFAPAGGLNRGMLAVLLSRLDAMGHSGEVIAGKAAFPDVADGVYCDNAVSWAVDKGLMTAENGGFLPNRAVTRMEWVSGLYQLAKHMDLAVSVKDGVLDGFWDSATIPAGDKVAMSWGVTAGVLQGSKDGRLLPTAPVTRAQAAVMLQRVLPLLGQ